MQLYKYRLTIGIETFVENLLHGIFRSFQCVLSPSLAVLTAQDLNLTFVFSQGGEMGNFDDDRSENNDYSM